MRTIILFLLITLFSFKILNAQNHPPVAVYDTLTLVAQEWVLIDVLANDYDPDGDSIFITHVYNNTGEAYIEDGKIWLKPSWIPEDQGFLYTISDGQYTDEIHIGLNIILNSDAPVALPDIFNITQMIPDTLFPLANDSDINGDLFKISRIDYESGCTVQLNHDSSSVTVIAAYTHKCSFYYQIKETGGDHLYSQLVKVLVHVAYNPDRPVAMPDTAFTTGGIAIDMPVLENDYDLQGEEIEIGLIENASFPSTIEKIGNIIRCTPPASWVGPIRFSYTVRETIDTVIYSKPAWVEVHVNQNSHCPVAMPDTAYGMTGVPITIDVLANDYDPDGDLFEISNTYPSNPNIILLELDNKLVYTSRSFQTGWDSLMYIIGGEWPYYSQRAKVMIHLDPNPAFPLAINDTVTTYAGFKIKIDPLENDIRNGFDSLELTSTYLSDQDYERVELVGNSIYYTPSYQTYGTRSFHYYARPVDLTNSNYSCRGNIVVNVLKLNYVDSLTVNNINAGVSANGDLFSDSYVFPDEQPGGPENSHFYYPVGEKTGTIFANRFFIGGIDNDNQLHQSGNVFDWQQGPVSDNRDSIYYLRYSRVWKITREEVEYHWQNYQTPDYQPSEAIRDWPGNGIWTSGEALHLAPFFDVNGDDNYIPEDGDYPVIRGDECIFFMCNDDLVRTEDTTALPLKVELHGMVYGFNNPADTALFNTVFLHYDIINRSEDTYSNCYAGIWTDYDIGDAADDYYKTEVQLSSFIGYNSYDIDGDGEEWAYGDNPPAQSVTVLAGPYLDIDGNDNPQGACDESINGFNFGNGIVDDERFGLSRAIEYSTYDWYLQGRLTYPEMYNFMNGIWDDDSPVLYGGNGHETNGATGPQARYMFPGDSDPLNYGTNCEFPANGYNQGTKFWTEEQVVNFGSDRRGLGSMGPFTLEPDQVQEIDLAYCIGQGNNGAMSSVNQLLRNIDSLRYAVAHGQIIVPNSSLGIQASERQSTVSIYPNPATDIIAISNMPASGKAEYSIFNLYGTKVLSGNLTGERPTIKTGNLTSGMYVLRVTDGKNVSTGKFVKL